MILLRARTGMLCLIAAAPAGGQLGDDQKADVTAKKAVQLMLATPMLIKRPVLDTGNKLIIGFKARHYEAEL
jgi:arsenate reductase